MKSRESLKRISFLAHSLGGLIARYAVGVLYTRIDDKAAGQIAGLEAISFITLATPHLGVRGNKQVLFSSHLNLIQSLVQLQIY